ncbi:MAG TPA: acyl-CoA dehydrogenase family protein [Candidatus Binatia bacterium]|nr:acyl-CoA dehydrogenase family protein [Candidatus Binatia bacterium]
MDFSLSSDQQALRDNIVRFAREVLNEGVVQRDREQVFPRDLWRKCGAIGIQGLPVPEEWGGSGLDPLSTAIALDGLGYGCEDGGLVFSLCAHLLSCVVPLWRFGTDEQKRRYLPGLCDGTLVGVHAMTEPGSGSDSFALKTRAHSDGDHFRLKGTKTFISNGPVADLVIVFALTDPDKGYHGGVTAFLVETTAPGFAVSQRFEKMGLRTSPIGELVFEDVAVPAGGVLGGVGGGSAVFTHAMDWERVCLFAAHLGTMERLLQRAIAHARTRSQFGQRIGKFQAVAHRIVDMKVHLEAARLLVYRAASRLERTRTVSMDAAIAKLFVSESLLRAALDTVQIHGGYGYMTEYEIERALRDAVGSTLYSGTSEMQRNIIARWLGL